MFFSIDRLIDLLMNLLIDWFYQDVNLSTVFFCGYRFGNDDNCTLVFTFLCNFFPQEFYYIVHGPIELE